MPENGRQLGGEQVELADSSGGISPVLKSYRCKTIRQRLSLTACGTHQRIDAF